MLGYGRDGAEAEFTLALPDELVPKPRTLDFVQAAAVPLTDLTAWQAFFDHASLVVAQTVLIHGPACRRAGHRDRLGPQSRLSARTGSQRDHRLYHHPL